MGMMPSMASPPPDIADFHLQAAEVATLRALANARRLMIVCKLFQTPRLSRCRRRAT